MFDLLLNNAHLVWRGLSVTIAASALVIGAGTLGGLFGGLALLYGPLPLRLLMRIYVDTIRGIPLLVLIFSVFYGLPALGLPITGFVSAVLALAIFGTAHVSEVVRGAVDSIPDGQTEAAKSIGGAAQVTDSAASEGCLVGFRIIGGGADFVDVGIAQQLAPHVQ